ncbi:MAG TPA: NUDIX domain-containing protein [Kofleriaceae bacterium]|nr:NUDIX domain-containing protein [Kofleriaceae bacterium]
MSRAPIPTWYFAMVVVRRGHRFLLTQEQKYGSTWSIPGGRVEPGESLVAAAVREVHEETGVPVRIDGILRIEHAASDTTARVRVLFAGSPIDDTPPKTVADAESLGAAWLTIDEIRQKPLRGAELRAVLESVEAGRQIFPLDLLGQRELSV